MYVNICVITHVQRLLTATQTLQNHLVACTRALLPPTDSIPRHHRSDVAVGVVDDLSARRVGRRPRSRCRSIARGLPFPPRAHYRSDRPINSRWIDRSAGVVSRNERPVNERGFRFILIAGASPAVSRSRISRRYNTRTRVSFARGDGHPPIARDVTNVIIYQ